jgi:Protein of unknown function (DUF1559)
MRARIQVGVVIVALLVVAALGMHAVQRARDSATQSICYNNLHQVAMCLEIYHDARGHYLRATVAQSDLPPERRLSWLVDLKPFMEAGCKELVDPTKPWDDEVNWPVRSKCKTSSTNADGRMVYEERLTGEIKSFLCSCNPQRHASNGVGLMHFVGVAGVGEDSATWPLGHAGIGLFGYDRQVCRDDIKNGVGHTLAMIETNRDNGPWTASGPATVRAFDPGGPAYIGPGGQFDTNHPKRGLWNVSRMTIAAFIDGHVREFTEETDPRLLEALATIAGDEKVTLPNLD